MIKPWNKTTWLDKYVTQIPIYPSNQLLNQVVCELTSYPHLVTVQEIEQLRQALVQVADRKAVLLQLGDCAESFTEIHPITIQKKVIYLNRLAKMIQRTLNIPVIRVGRMAGQYAKPRSIDFEWSQGHFIHAYRGDAINSQSVSLKARTPQPKRMLTAYRCAETVLHIIKHYNAVCSNQQMMYTSHEALLLFYEQACTEYLAGRWYNLSTHFPWLGMRTAMIPESAHVEYLRGIYNPIAIKIGPTVLIEQLASLITQLDPQAIPGKITLIHRLGDQHVERILPKLITVVQHLKRKVIWLCDPMHGNTQFYADTGHKIRLMRHILSEIRKAVYIHDNMGSYLGGLHLEATHDTVLECIDDPIFIKNRRILHRGQYYKSLLDPRLNDRQSVKAIQAFIAASMKKALIPLKKCF